MSLLKPSGNGLYLLKHSTPCGRLSSVDRIVVLDTDVALTALCDPIIWHKRFGHLSMQSLHAQHINMFLYFAFYA
jgi:hypothetical protein